MVVIVARANGVQRIRRAVLARREKADGINLQTIPVLGIGTALYIVRHVVVVDEGDTAALGHADIQRIHAA